MFGAWSRASLESGVGKVGNGLRHSAEGRRGLYPAHREGHRDRYHRCFPFVPGEDDGELRALIGPYEEPIEAIFEVVLG